MHSDHANKLKASVEQAKRRLPQRCLFSPE